MARLLKYSVMLAMIALTISAASAADNSMFNYQGRVLVQGIPYTGTGRMKAAIIATTATSTVSIWSNDGTSVGGLEPTNSFDVSVTAGVFDVMIGDASAGMAAIPAIMFNRDDELKVRVWFNDGVHGYQQLMPDRRLTHPRRLGLTEVHSETHLYVNSVIGNDINSGLTPTTGPKKTIQAAINMIPSQVRNNVTIHLAGGTYRESVFLSGIQAQNPYKLILSGDATTVPTDTVSPDIRITGTDNDLTHAKTRTDGIVITGCYNIELDGILVDYFSNVGVISRLSSVSLIRCKAANNTVTGISSSNGGMSATNCWAMNSTFAYGGSHGDMSLTNSGASDSTFGIFAAHYGVYYLSGTNYVRRNTWGITCQTSYIWFDSASTCYVTNNTTGIYLYYNSCSRLISTVSYSGNSTNQLIASDSWAE